MRFSRTVTGSQMLGRSRVVLFTLLQIVSVSLLPHLAHLLLFSVDVGLWLILSRWCCVLASLNVEGQSKGMAIIVRVGGGSRQYLVSFSLVDRESE